MGQMPLVQAQLPKITGMTVRAARVKMDEPHITASGTVAESPLILTDITTDAGIVGHSLIFTYTLAALKPTADLLKNLEPLIVSDVLAPIEVEQKLSQRFRLLGTQGLVGMALAAIDMALWDALARLHGVSLTQLLGGTAKPIRAYGAVGYEGPKGSAAVAERWAKRGFKGVKAKIGYPTVEEDLAVVRAMRSACGTEMAIMVDYNQCLDPVEAMRRTQVLDEEGLTWIEEPTLAHDYAGHARIAAATRTPLQCGENWWGVLDMQHAIDAAASDYMMPEVMKIGGVTGWMRAATLAAGKSIPVSNHLWSDISAQLMCCAATASWLEYSDWWNPILAEPLRIENGATNVKGVIGSGTEWNEHAVKQFLA